MLTQNIFLVNDFHYTLNSQGNNRKFQYNKGLGEIHRKLNLERLTFDVNVLENSVYIHVIKQTCQHQRKQNAFKTIFHK